MDGRRIALIVANEVYDDPVLSHLRSPAADAAALAAVLSDRQISDFDVRVLLNETSHVVQSQVEDLFLDSAPDDVLLLHFSCHGVKSQSGELYFAARNTRPSRLGSSAVAAEFVQRCMRMSRSRSIVLLLDCCYGGAFSEGVSVRAGGDVNVLDSFSGGRGQAVITASTAMEYAFEGDHLTDDHEVRPSVFTAALVEGLTTGDADRDEDGLVSLNELYDYVFDRVRERNPNQTPSRDFKMQGELYLARSKRRRIRPLAMPSDLQAATVDPNMFTRLGAVSELRTRLWSHNLPVAAGAHAALVEMARTDIRNVADAAKSALRQSELRPSTLKVQLGRLAQGTKSPVHGIQLHGTPLARACTFEVSEPWIHVREIADGLAVSVDTTHVAVLQGHIIVRCSTGETTISVHAQVLPRTPRPPLPAPHAHRPPPPREPPPVTPLPPEPPQVNTMSKRNQLTLISVILALLALLLVVVGLSKGTADGASALVVGLIILLAAAVVFSRRG